MTIDELRRQIDDAKSGDEIEIPPGVILGAAPVGEMPDNVIVGWKFSKESATPGSIIWGSSNWVMKDCSFVTLPELRFPGWNWPPEDE